ncbi:MAG: alpha/beta hydrolase [Candidatus Eremiobacteraeota bacterium]|nr:alpha/beta hydrolase [Candidatus Eremiobacteraeota bacterium]
MKFFVQAVLAAVALCVVPASAAPLAPAPQSVESFDVGTLHVDRYGTGKRPVVLIPGLGSGPWVWYGTIAHFSTDYSMYVLTLPGFDGRPATAETPLFSTFASDFNALLDGRKIERPIVVGHSLGGTLAIRLGELAPDRLRAIVAVDGLPIFPPVATLSQEQRTASAGQAAAAFASLDPAGVLASEKRFMSGFGTSDPALVDPIAALEARSDPKALAAWLQEDVQSDFRPELSKISIPLLEIMPYFPPDHVKPPLQFTQEQAADYYRSLLAGAPHVTVAPLPDARHFAMLDQPDAFYAILGPFLAANF